MRVVLHAHSDWSYDGVWDLARIARFYGRFGVSAVMMSEHDTGFDPGSFPAYRAACEAASTARCKLIPGIEYSSPDNDIHILTWGLETFLAEHRPVVETLEKVKEAGGAAVFAHPVRRKAWAKFDRGWVPYLSGVELWNRKSDGVSFGRQAYELIRETGLAATVGQDFHRLRHVYPLTMGVKPGVEATEAALVGAVRAREMVPLAFRRPLLNADGVPLSGFHDRAEGVRIGLRDLRNRLRGK